MTTNINRSLGVAIIGVAQENYGLGPYIARIIENNPNSKLVAIGDKQISINAFINNGENVDRSKIKSFSIADIESLFQENEVELVIIASPETTHLDYLHYGVKYNKSILVEKSIIPLYQEPSVLDPIFKEANNKDLLIATNCQRAFIPRFLNCHIPLKKVLIKMVIGVKKEEEDNEGLVRLILPHLVSILVALDLKEEEMFDRISVQEKSLGAVRFEFMYNSIFGVFVLEQKRDVRFARLTLEIDDDIIFVTPIIENNKVITEYTYNKNKIYSDDLLKSNLDTIVDYILFKSFDRPIVDNLASLQIARIGYAFYRCFSKAYTGF